MTISADTVEQIIRQKRLPGLSEQLPPHEFIIPHYEGLSITNLPATIAALLGAELPGAAPPLPQELWADLGNGLRRVVLVILDAMGYQRFRRALAADGDLAFNRLVEQGRLIPLTSVFPSTTTAALCTFWSGRSPAEHGMLGYELYLREYGTVANMLAFSPVESKHREVLVEWGLEPEKFLPVPGLAEMLAPQGVITRTLINSAYTESPLSKITFRGVEEVHGIITSSDMWVTMRQMISAHREERLLLIAYWGGVDGVAHRYGPDADTWPAEIHNLAFSMEREFLRPLEPADREGTLLLITADHGQVNTDPTQAIRLCDHPRLRDALILPPTGESRAAFLYLRCGYADEVRRYFAGPLNGRFAVVDSRQALEAGLFGPGPLAPETPFRIGDLLALARGDAVLHHGKKEPRLRGRHGGLTPEEMLVPLLMVRLDG